MQNTQKGDAMSDQSAKISVAATPGAAVTFLLPSNATPDTPGSSTSGSLSLLMQPNVEFQEISFEEKVGHGSYGVVYKAMWKEQLVAVKEFDATAEQKAIETEVKQLSRVRHPNIIALFGISAHNQSKYLIMEYAEGGSLHNFLHGKVKPAYSTAHAISWARQCADGVAYLHDMKPKPLIHRDLKPLNLLLTNKGRHLKICDFGTVADKCTLMTNNKGSAAWMAPEVFEGSKYTEKCDIFSWAIVLWEVLSRQQPFKESDNTYSIMWKIHKGERPPMIKDCPEPIRQLMESCWATQPDSRPSMQHVLIKMNELAACFHGADEPLEYEFINQQIICPQSSWDETDNNYTLDFSDFTNSTTNATSSITPTNSDTASSGVTPTNGAAATGSTIPLSQINSQVPIGCITASTTRWDVIPEENESLYLAAPAEETIFNLTPTAEAAKRYETIRSDMNKNAQGTLPPLSLEVDPNCWELPRGGNAFNNTGAKSDGKEHLTVTETKPLLSTTTTTSSAQDTLNNNTISGFPPGHNFLPDAFEDDDKDADGTEQSLHEMLEPELQPEPPIAENQESQAIYREHRRLAKEYLQVDTELYYAQKYKEELLTQMEPEERRKKEEILKKINERDELMELYRNLKQQLEKGNDVEDQQLPMHLPICPNLYYGDAPEALNQESMPDDWEIINPNQNT